MSAMNFNADVLSPGFGHRDFLQSSGMRDSAAQALEAISQEASYSTADAANLNDLFGAALYVQSNLEANFFGAIPKVDRSAANTDATQPLPLTFRAAFDPPALQTHAEGGEIPEGRKYGRQKVSGDIKRSVAVIEQSDLSELRAQLLDGVPLDELTRVDELYQELAIDRDALAAPVESGNDGYADRDEVTELDRVIASGDEEANGVDVNGDAFTDGDLDVYDIDRSEDSWADAFVDFNDTGDPRQLTKSLIDGFLSDFFDFGDATRENVAILTGRRTADVLNDLSDKARYSFDPTAGGRESLNDADTVHGVPGTTRRRHYDGIPIVPNQNVPTHGNLPSIYVIPTDTISAGGGTEVPRLAIEEYATPYVETSGRGETQGFLATGSFENKVLYKMDHELIMRDFSAAGKLRDLEA